MKRSAGVVAGLFFLAVPGPAVAGERPSTQATGRGGASGRGSGEGEVLKDGSISYKEVAPFLARIKRKAKAKNGRWVTRFRISRGNRVEVFAQSTAKKWGSYYYKVRYGKREGWVGDSYLSKLGEITPQMKREGDIYALALTPTAATVKRRTKVKDGRFVTRFQVGRGDKVEVDRKSAFKWWGSLYYRIRHQGKTGWVSKESLDLSAEPQLASASEAKAPGAPADATPPSPPTGASATPAEGSGDKPSVAAGSASDGASETPPSPPAVATPSPAKAGGTTPDPNLAMRVYLEVHQTLDPGNWDVQDPVVGAIGYKIWRRLAHDSPNGDKFLNQAYAPLAELGIPELEKVLSSILGGAAPAGDVLKMSPLDLVGLFRNAKLLEFLIEPKPGS